jgi:hypothetical protein
MDVMNRVDRWCIYCSERDGNWLKVEGKVEVKKPG